MSVVIRDAAAIVAALEDPALVPPPRSGGGAALQLRASMARFSPPAEHPARRAAVVAAIGRIEPDAVAHAATVFTLARLDPGGVDAVSDIAAVVPTTALSSFLPVLDGQPPASEFDIVAAVAAMVGVIGHGAPVTARADAAVSALVARFGVEGASLLYQNYDATAALITTRLVARASGRAAVPAVPRTKRVAAHPHGATGSGEVTLEIGAAGLPFGAGSHRCPGEQLAQALAKSVVETISSAGYAPHLARTEYDSDGRPTRLPLHRIADGRDDSLASDARTPGLSAGGLAPGQGPFRPRIESTGDRHAL
ncbi:hypothetical protein K0817_008155 [Microbacterium sp. HD4P20]|uniref:hypothetical protein n=1 Tax=Microbacterium sp. HD4P20 TaxID=2864874 RepID=UPI001C6433F4|nr:hypothetical protein [Microbacterium sp. HD4P20]MCP2636541.1 hypothetical protein [Microbacterium sp. HD4P20]